MNKYEAKQKKQAAPQIQTIRIADIQNKFDVRISLDQDRVLQFVGAYQDPEKEVPPIQVVAYQEGFAYVDGRHRAAAKQYLNLETIEAEILDKSFMEDTIELFALALESNCGGAMTPTRADITHTIMRMLEFGAGNKELVELLRFLPLGALKAYIADARGRIQKRKITKAIDAIANEGLNQEQAAKKYGIKVESLKDALQGKKGKWGKNRKNEVEIATSVKSAIAKSLRSVNHSIGNEMNKLFELVEDGSISAKQAMGVLTMWESRNSQTLTRIRDWKQRLLAISKSHRVSDANMGEPSSSMDEDTGLELVN